MSSVGVPMGYEEDLNVDPLSSGSARPIGPIGPMPPNGRERRLEPIGPAVGPLGPSNGSNGSLSSCPEPRPVRRRDFEQDPEFSECGICFENVKRRGERFGMLESCDHAFCLSCIRGWRREREQDKQNLRLCPVCRKESFYVIPSDAIILDPAEKRQIIDQYKQEMGRIPCKLFDYGRGSCQFGNSCFYAHLNPDGTRYIPPPLKWMRGAEGSEVKSEVKLSDFFD